MHGSVNVIHLGDVLEAALRVCARRHAVHASAMIVSLLLAHLLVEALMENNTDAETFIGWEIMIGDRKSVEESPEQLRTVKHRAKMNVKSGPSLDLTSMGKQPVTIPV